MWRPRGRPWLPATGAAAAMVAVGVLLWMHAGTRTESVARPSLQAPRGATVTRSAAAAVAAAALAPDVAAAGGTSASGLGNVTVRRVEDDASVALQVKDVPAAFSTAGAIAQALGGYVQSSTLLGGASGPVPTPPGTAAPATGLRPALPAPPPDGGPFASLVLAVPQGQLQAGLSQVEALGRLSRRIRERPGRHAAGHRPAGPHRRAPGRAPTLPRPARAGHGHWRHPADPVGADRGPEPARRPAGPAPGPAGTQRHGLRHGHPAAHAGGRGTGEAGAVPAAAPPAGAAGLGALAARGRATDLGLAVAWCLPWAALGAMGYGIHRLLAARSRS